MKFIIEGIPIAQGRPRFARNHVYDPNRKQKRLVQTLLNMQMTNNAFIRLKDCPIEVKMIIHMPKIKKRQKRLEIGLNSISADNLPDLYSSPAKATDEWHIARPDTTNIFKFFEDCLIGIAYDDDSLVCKLYAEKIRSDHPRVEIEVKEIL